MWPPEAVSGWLVVVVVSRVRGGNVIVIPEFCGFLLYVN